MRFGGLASEATGGSFEDGAMTALFVHLFNDETGTVTLTMKGGKSYKFSGDRCAPSQWKCLLYGHNINHDTELSKASGKQMLKDTASDVADVATGVGIITGAGSVYYGVRGAYGLFKAASHSTYAARYAAIKQIRTGAALGGDSDTSTYVGLLATYVSNPGDPYMTFRGGGADFYANRNFDPLRQPVRDNFVEAITMFSDVAKYAWDNK